MNLAHFGVAYAAKKFYPQVSFGAYFIAAIFADLVIPLTVVSGLEKIEVVPGYTAVSDLKLTFPYTHSLFFTLIWALVFAGIYRLFFTNQGNKNGYWWVALVVLSHWILDFISHPAHLPLSPFSDHMVGLGLYNSLPATLVVELALFFGGVALYVSTSRARDRIGQWGLWGLTTLLLIMGMGATFGPPPDPGTFVVGFVMLLLMSMLAYWVDGHREIKSKVWTS